MIQQFVYLYLKKNHIKLNRTYFSIYIYNHIANCISGVMVSMPSPGVVVVKVKPKFYKLVFAASPR